MQEDRIVAAKLSKGTIGVRADIRYADGREHDVSPRYLSDVFGETVYNKIEAGFNTWVEL